ncbi:MAG: 30S ribosomal protein S8 [Pseudomonadales bacterium]|jgi:small subunit ribosomal protein S8|nr:30S ribosomal protein S8 [Anaerolineae bacterium]MCC6529338.1 30S ribosomal protein S8 [Pseudomonadales bacterium]HNI72086.1 30S ribosomal protein S8 [Accumulibacter sp.]HNW13834.1 30S ribosomal protein S8 [Anaerolineaceae bacterium]MCP5332283.1 30S ribosomal protein S8 [Pseudomonadales bacterium]
MSMQDPLADLLTRIRNAQMAGLKQVSISASKIKIDVVKVLKSEGYIADYSCASDDLKPLLTINLKYHEGAGVISEIKRISRPGLRRYCASQDIPKVKDGLGVAILTTSRGVMTDRDARKAGVGGEVICTVF